MNIDSDTFNRLRLESLKTGKSMSELLKVEQGRRKGPCKASDEDEEREHRHNRHDEDDLQMRCVSRFDEFFNRYRLMLNHCPSEGRRSMRDGVRFKKMGLRAGYPDLVLHLPRHGYGCLGIELKTPKGAQSETQRMMQEEWTRNGNLYMVIRSVEQFLALCHWYIKGEGELVLPEASPPRPIRPKAKPKRRNKTKK